MKHYSTYQSQFIEMFSAMPTTPVKTYVDDSFPGEWGTEDTIGDGVKVIRTTNFTNSGKLNLADVVTRSIEDRKVSRKQIKKYDTILERSGGTADNPVGRVVLFEEDDLFLCNNFTQVLRFKDIDPRFAFYSLYYFYQTNKTAIRSMGSKTTGIQNLNMSKYLEIGIPNASDEAQKEFVAIAEQADKSKFTSLKSQFIEMFGGIQNDSKWPLKSLGELCEMVNGYAFKSTKYSESGYSIIRIANVQKGSIDDSDKVYYSEQHKDEFSDSILKEGDILISLTGNVGRAGVIYNKHLPAALNQRVQGLRIKNASELNHQYLFSLLNLDCFEELCIKNASGSAQLNLSTVWLRNCKIVCPRIEEQTKFALIAHQADKSKYIN